MEGLKRTEQNEVFDTEKRFKQIEVLRETLSLEPLDILSYGSEVEFIDTPTIGIEIEMTWMQAFPDMGAAWQDSTVRPSDLLTYTQEYKAFHEEYNRHDKALKPTLEQVERVIPRVGRDAYWEFSFLPSKHIGVSLAELQTLYDASILREGTAYATHMTIAEIDNDRDAFAFLCGLELSGGSNAERIGTAIHSSKGAWSRKGKGGLLKRQPGELMGEDTQGYEFRTLVATSFGQMSSLFHRAQQLASMLKHNPDEWKVYRKHIESALKKSGLELAAWNQPKYNSSPWLIYSELLSQK